MSYEHEEIYNDGYEDGHNEIVMALMTHLIDITPYYQLSELLDKVKKLAWKKHTRSLLPHLERNHQER